MNFIKIQKQNMIFFFGVISVESMGYNSASNHSGPSYPGTKHRWVIVSFEYGHQIVLYPEGYQRAWVIQWILTHAYVDQ